ncbi:MAG: hypothetical protein ACMXYK_01050 [Candidatus Woesearchaeota archaeon]
MAKSKKKALSKKNLGMILIAALIIQYVFPAITLGSLAWIATVLYLGVALYLLFF